MRKSIEGWPFSSQFPHPSFLIPRCSPSRDLPQSCRVSTVDRITGFVGELTDRATNAFSLATLGIVRCRVLNAARR